MASVAGERVAPDGVGLVALGRDVGWGQMWVACWEAWREAHPGLVTRWTRLRVWGLWAALVWLVVVALVMPKLREALTTSLSIYWLLLCWFWMTRTRTVSWRMVSLLYAASIVWAVVVAVVTHRLSVSALTELGVPGSAELFGPTTVIAGLGEEAGKLVPLAVIVVVAAGRARRFAVTDWLVLGLACGLGFQLAEDVARRVEFNAGKPGLLGGALRELMIGDDRGPDTGFAQYGLSPFGGWSSWAEGAQWPGHHASTALVAVCVGLGVAAWRHAGRVSRVGAGSVVSGTAWRVVGVVAPVVMLWLVVSVHAGGNATARVEDEWTQTENPSMPWLIRLGWAVANHGVGLRWLLVALLVLALVIDARRLRAADEGAGGPVLAVPFVGSDKARAWTSRVVSTDLKGSTDPTDSADALGSAAQPPSAVVLWWRRCVAAVVVAAAYIWRDLQFMIQAHTRDKGESRLVALSRGRVGMQIVRKARAEAMARAADRDWPVDRPRRRAVSRSVVRVVGAVVLVFLVWSILWWAPEIAAGVGRSWDAPTPLPRIEVPPDWFAGLLDGLAKWWDGLSFGQQLLVGFGIAALIALSGGSLVMAFGLSGVATYGLSKSAGIATFMRDPGAATRRYFSTVTPLGLLADIGEGVLTFLPGNFVGANTGRYVRDGVDYFIDNPEVFWEAQARVAAEMRARPERGSVSLEFLLGRKGNGQALHPTRPGFDDAGYPILDERADGAYHWVNDPPGTYRNRSGQLVNSGTGSKPYVKDPYTGWQKQLDLDHPSIRAPRADHLPADPSGWNGQVDDWGRVRGADQAQWAQVREGAEAMGIDPTGKSAAAITAEAKGIARDNPALKGDADRLRDLEIAPIGRSLLRASLYAHWLRCRSSTGLRPAFGPAPCHCTHIETLATAAPIGAIS